MWRFSRAVRTLLGLVIAVGSLTPRPLQAQPKLSDWKAAEEAAGKERGCESIPYSNYRDPCASASTKVESRCKTDSWTCKGLETRKSKENISNLTERLDGWKKERDRMSGDSSGTDDQKRERQKKVSEITKTIDDKSKEMEWGQS